MPDPLLTRHALERMAERGITEDQVHAALTHELYRTPGQAGTIWVHGLAGRGETLKVCVTVDMSTVITAAWPDQ